MPKNSSILISGGRIIDPSQNLDALMDLLVENGKIKSIDRPGQIPASKAAYVLNAKGCWILPGLIDSHVHLREPGFEYKETIETGTRAAIAGGFTSIACMANTQPVNDTPYVTAFIREKAKTVASCRVYPIGAISKGLKGEELAEIGGMVTEGAIAVSDDGVPVMNSYLMRKAMDYAKAFSVPVISHAEDLYLLGQGVMNESSLSNELGLRGNPSVAEEIMVARDIALCKLTRCPLHIAHISSAGALEHLKRAKEAGLPVTAEATPHHLILTEEAVRGYDTNMKTAPPLRSEADKAALRQALAQGLIDIIASDHAPHGLVDKAVEFDQAASGVIGLQTTVAVTLRLVNDKIISVNRWVESLTSNPAKLLNLNSGTLKPGSEGDITIIDPDKTWKFSDNDILSKSNNSPFIGWEFKGQVKHTIIGGELVFGKAHE
ncbi:MAG: dihydroorotase [Bdellovibrionota bacterium]